MSTPVKKVPIHLQSSQNRLLIKNGKIVNEDDTIEEDVYVEDGVIKEIGKNLIIPGGTRVIDARGRYVIPGGIDPHTHFEFEFMGTTTVDDFYQGTKAAIAGGTTMIIDFAFPKQGESLLDAYYSYREKADSKVCCDYGLHIAITNWSDRVKEDMTILCSQHGINSFKTFMAYSFMLNDSELYSVFEHCKNLGAVPQVHAENGPEGHELSRPEEVEAEAVNRACTIAHQVDSPLYVVHVMSKSAGFAVKQARERGVQVIGETLVAGVACDGSHYKNPCFNHLAAHVNSPLCVDAVSCGLTADIIKEKRSNGQNVYGTVYVSNLALVGNANTASTITTPPIRSNPGTPAQLLGYLGSDILQLTGSDNCTFNKNQKEMGIKNFSKIPNGVNGVEDRMSVIWEKGVESGIIDPMRFVAITSTNAAKIFNIFPRKGCIGVGSDADIVIWNPSKTRVISAKTHHQAVDFNIFEGMECHGVPEYVIVNGRVCVDEEQLRAVQGHGKFIETPVFPAFVYNPDKLADIRPAKNGTLNEVELANKLAKIELEPKVYNMPTLPNSAVSTPSCRGPRPEGQRNIQESTFSVSEELDVERKSCIRVKNPPGGKSSGFW
ncbi:hypothetical protein Trydic_g14414 [Trypoxylus dichotomus]